MCFEQLKMLICCITLTYCYFICLLIVSEYCPNVFYFPGILHFSRFSLSIFALGADSNSQSSLTKFFAHVCTFYSEKPKCQSYIISNIISIGSVYVVGFFYPFSLKKKVLYFHYFLIMYRNNCSNITCQKLVV